ncbi:hypothetical protein [Azospirillum thiophilum]|uniref:hypothetical protein n=1 Tax=Azospirillum thiophilum TaxID=528244 RepID=UPI00118771A5|nr:hypothetical protein [Azospirillum thiophilum]
MSAAGWLRSLAVDMTSAARPEDVQRSRRRRPVHVPAEDLAEVSRLVGKLGTVAGALIQFAKRSREDGDAHLHAEAEAALADLRAIQPTLVDVAESLKRTAKKAAKKPAP